MPPSQRRSLFFANLDEVLAEVDRLAVSDVKTVGRFSLGQIFTHLAITMDVTSGHIESPVKLTFPMSLLVRLMRPVILNFKMMPGFKLPPEAQSVFWPNDDVSTEQGAERLRQSIARFRVADPLPPHPFFGVLTPVQAEKMQCRHCELHLSFAVPKIETIHSSQGE